MYRNRMILMMICYVLYRLRWKSIFLLRIFIPCNDSKDNNIVYKYHWCCSIDQYCVLLYYIYVITSYIPIYVHTFDLYILELFCVIFICYWNQILYQREYQIFCVFLFIYFLWVYAIFRLLFFFFLF